MGCAFTTVAEGTMSQKVMDELNGEVAGMMHIESTNRDSHMWVGETCVRFFDHLSQELRRKRQSLGLQASDRALVICDKCSSHQSSVFQAMRVQWAKENNVQLLGADSSAAVQVPGGFGAVAGPNDQWHGHFHMLRASHLRHSLGLNATARWQETVGVQHFGSEGVPVVTCPIRQSILSDCWALQQIAEKEGGKTLLWAWLRTGYISEEQAAEWNFGGDLLKLKEAMRTQKGSYQKLLRLQHAPVLDFTKYNTTWRAAKGLQSGESFHAWFAILDEVEQQLPSFMNTGIELAITMWMATRRAWDKLIAERASKGKPLTPGQLAKYNAWRADPMRHVVFDVRKKTDVPKPSTLSTAALAECVVASLRMSPDPNTLAIKFGKQDSFSKLVVRQMTAKAPAASILVPEEVTGGTLPEAPAAGGAEHDDDLESVISETDFKGLTAEAMDEENAKWQEEAGGGGKGRFSNHVSSWRDPTGVSRGGRRRSRNGCLGPGRVSAACARLCADLCIHLDIYIYIHSHI